MKENDFVKIVFGYLILTFTLIACMPINNYWLFMCAVLTIGGWLLQLLWNKNYKK